MIRVVQHLVRATDALVARAYLALRRERGALVPFLFHSLFRDEDEIRLNHVDPLERTTVAHFRQLVEYYLGHGYRFVSPADVLAGLDPAGRWAMLTFDDGYYNNVHALPILREFGVPATFFISTDHVRESRCFWWDVLYRERRARGASPGQIYREAVRLKPLRTELIESRLEAAFGPGAFRPRGDVDRPFTAGELAAFARDPLVHLGNHTAHHAILTNYTPDEIRGQIRRGQEALREMTGTAPISIAYPNGAVDEAVMAACADAGIRVGFTVRPEKTRLPLPRTAPADRLLRVGRFVPVGAPRMTAQCRTYRSDLRLYGALRSTYVRLMRGRVTQ
jgi:peptidoglycan/xylan/chitin deacetylase (PgdA/CDA1 family)